MKTSRIVLTAVLMLLFTLACGTIETTPAPTAEPSPVPTTLAVAPEPTALGDKDEGRGGDEGDTEGLAVLTLLNYSGENACNVYIAPSGAGWGDDQLGDTEVVNDGDARTFSLNPGTYDIKVEDCSHGQLYLEESLAVSGDVSVMMGGVGGIGDAIADGAAPLTLINNTGQTVCYVYISPTSNEESWGGDWLWESEVVDDGVRRTFAVPRGMYDLRIDNCSHEVVDIQMEVDLTTEIVWTVTPAGGEIAVGGTILPELGGGGDNELTIRLYNDSQNTIGAVIMRHGDMHDSSNDQNILNDAISPYGIHYFHIDLVSGEEYALFAYTDPGLSEQVSRVYFYLDSNGELTRGWASDESYGPFSSISELHWYPLMSVLTLPGMTIRIRNEAYTIDQLYLYPAGIPNQNDWIGRDDGRVLCAYEEDLAFDALNMEIPEYIDRDQFCFFELDHHGAYTLEAFFYGGDSIRIDSIDSFSDEIVAVQLED